MDAEHGGAKAGPGVEQGSWYGEGEGYGLDEGVWEGDGEEQRWDEAGSEWPEEEPGEVGVDHTGKIRIKQKSV